MMIADCRTATTIRITDTANNFMVLSSCWEFFWWRQLKAQVRLARVGAVDIRSTLPVREARRSLSCNSDQRALRLLPLYSSLTQPHSLSSICIGASTTSRRARTTPGRLGYALIAADQPLLPRLKPKFPLGDINACSLAESLKWLVQSSKGHL